MDIGHKLKVCLLSAATVVLGLAFSADGAVVDDATRMGSEMMNPSGSIGITEKSKSGDFKILFYGNSITSHAPCPGIGWTNDCGMAASSKEKDYAHIVIAELERRLGKKADFRIRNLAPFERNYTTNVASVAEIVADAAWSPDYVVIALGENAPNVNDSTAADYTKFLVDLARPFAGKGKKVVLRSPFWVNPKKAECTEKAAAEVGAVYVDAGPLGRVAENKALGLFSHKGVANHPGDLGMKRIAELVLSGFFPQAESGSSIGRVRELLAKVEGREECKKMDFFDLEQPVAVTGDTAVALKLRCEVTGDCVMYWRSESMPNFVSECGVRFSAIGDGQYHSYVLRPDWKVSDRIVKLRIDFPYDRKNPDRQVSNDIKGVIFVRNGFAPFDSKDADGIVFRMKSDKFEYLSMNWKARKGEKDAKPFYMGFTTIPDGREHTFWFDLRNTKERITFGAPHWYGTIEGFCFRANLRAAEFTPKGVEFVKGVPSIPADPVVRQVFPEDAIPRTGRPLPIEIVVRNYGTEPAEGIRFAVEGLPEGVRVLDPSDLSPKGSVAPSAGYDYIRDDYMPNGLPNERRFRITLSDPGRPVDFTAKLVLSANGGARSEKSFHVKVLPSLGLAKCAYPPEPRPLDTGDVEIGVFLFPGWVRHQWYPAWDAKPERKPMLGWYDDRLPEVRDWQIKWLVENGVSYAFVDWYWDPGKGPRPGYWFEGIAKARYRKYLKYAALWCNEGSYRHSEKDQEEVTKYWIDNFFSDPQYMKIDGRPVIGMWGLNMDKALGPGGAKKLLAISQQLARDAGYPGIYFVSMHGDVKLADVRRRLKDDGFSASFEYCYTSRWSVHWPGLVNGAIDYSAVADSSLAHWRELREGCDLPFFPSLSTGWGNLPWLGDRGWEIANKTPGKFEKVCRDAKRFSDETGVKRLLLGPLDEWCEGEIGWPNAEHGFGMLEAVRETFAKKPPEGFPLNYGPQDVGLGPYTKDASVIDPTASR